MSFSSFSFPTTTLFGPGALGELPARLARWEPWAEHPATLESTRAYIRGALEDFARGRQISTIMAVDGGQRFIGRCGIRINAHLGAGDVGYWIDGDYAGRGLTSRAARA